MIRARNTNYCTVRIYFLSSNFFSMQRDSNEYLIVTLVLTALVLILLIVVMIEVSHQAKNYLLH